MLTNYVNQTVIINTNTYTKIDHSDIRNFIPNKDSIFLAPDQSTRMPISNKTNIYIITEDCKYLGHFFIGMMDLPKDPIIYIGLTGNPNVILTAKNALPSDVDFGLARVLDQRNPLIMILNPYFYIVIVLIMLLILFIFIKLVSCNNISSGN